MSTSATHRAYSRKAFLAQVAAPDRALAERLCELLEAAFPIEDIMLYGGGAMPIVVRDMEWIAGFAMRKAHPMAYCCSPAAREAMGAELEPYMSGKSCVAVKPRKGESIEVVLELVGRAFAVASRHGGIISKTDAQRRERMRREAAGSEATATTATEKKVGGKNAAAKKSMAKQATTKKALTKKSTTKKATTKKSTTKKATTKQATTKKSSTKKSTKKAALKSVTVGSATKKKAAAAGRPSGGRGAPARRSSRA
jgi:hypothetical protein